MLHAVGYLVGGLENVLFSIIYGIILPIDELIFFKMVFQPLTSYKPVLNLNTQ